MRARFQALGLRRRCCVYGCALPRDQAVYRMWHCEPLPGQLGCPMPPVTAMHKSCALFSAVAYPYLKRPESRGRRNGPRGPMVILGFADDGVLFTGRDPHEYTWGYVGHLDTVDTGSGYRDFQDDYERSLAGDRVDTATRLLWTDTAEDSAMLAQCAGQDAITLRELSEVARPYDASTPHLRLALI
jgi:hypothetical protein